VVRNGFSRNMAQIMIEDLAEETRLFERFGSNRPVTPERQRFHH
jgi:hypothetical protein